MKLQHVLERDWDRAGLKYMLGLNPHKPMAQAVNKKREEPDHEYVGSGSAAYVSRSTSPHEMDNVDRIANDFDGTSAFYRWLIENPLVAKNPYFPRIISNDSEHEVTTTKVERLFPYMSDKIMSMERLVLTWEELFDAPLPEIDGIEQERVMHMAEVLVESIHATAHGWRGELPIKDPYFKQAIACIKACKVGSIDIHTDNVMWRITGNKPHLVITDPFS